MVHTCSIWKFGIVIFWSLKIYHPIGDLIRKYFPELFMPYIDFSSLTILKIVEIFWKAFPISSAQIHKKSMFYIVLQELSNEIKLL